MSYLLGFPTPVVEMFIVLQLIFIVPAVWFGLRYEGLDWVTPTERDESIDSMEDNV